jgi:metal-sulfur cluster biosynthetic enzyme
MPTPLQIRDRLATISDPCSLTMGRPVDICALGLVEQVEEADGHVRVELCLTDPSCAHFNGLRRYITDTLLAMPGVVSAEVVQTTQVLWTPERITPKAGQG